MKYEDSAQTFLESYDDAIPAASYVRYSNEMYHYGELGVNYNTALNKLASQYARKVMPSNVLMAVYEEGVKSNNAESKENKKVTSIKSKGTGKVTVESEVSESFEKLAKIIAAATKQDIVITDKISEQGQFRPDVSSIVINAKSGKAVQTLFHEAVGEFMQAYGNEEDLQKVYSAVFEYMMTTDTDYVNKWVNNYYRDYNKYEGSKSWTEARDEMVNDFFVEMFNTEDGFKEFFDDAISRYGKQEAKTLKDIIIDFFNGLLEHLNKILNGESTQHKELADKMDTAKLQELRGMVLDAWNTAIGNYNGITVDENAKNAKQFSLMEFIDGRKFVSVETNQDLFDGLSEKDMLPMARMVINEYFSGKVIGKDNKAFVNGASASEYGRPSKRITDSSKKEAKARVSAELDNLIDAGRNFRVEADGRDGHIHPDAVNGFSYFDTTFKIGNEYFDGVINILNNKKGKLFKDLTKIENITEDITNSYGINPKFRFLRDASMDNVAQDTDSGNTSSVKNELNNTRNSIAVDSDGNELSQGQETYFADSKVRDEDGDLMVMYHGTVSDFTVFDRSYGNSEGDWGKGFYFTNMEYDADDNYGNEGGADLTNKIERLAEQLEWEDGYEDTDYEERLEVARKRFITADPHTLQVYLNVKNPVYVRESNPTYLFSDIYDSIDYDDYEDEDDYYDAIDEALADAFDGLQSFLEDEGYEGIDEIGSVLFQAAGEGGITLQNLKNEISQYEIVDEEGNYASGEVARLIAEYAGYDGIIDSTVSTKFKNMGLDSETVHVIVFNSNQAKNTDNLNPTDNDDIRYSLPLFDDRVALTEDERQQIASDLWQNTRDKKAGIKAINNERIHYINNKLVYTNRSAQNPRVHRIIEFNADDKYAISELQGVWVDYESNKAFRGTKYSVIQQSINDNYSEAVSGTVDIFINEYSSTNPHAGDVNTGERTIPRGVVSNPATRSKRTGIPAKFTSLIETDEQIAHSIAVADNVEESTIPVLDADRYAQSIFNDNGDDYGDKMDKAYNVFWENIYNKVRNGEVDVAYFEEDLGDYGVNTKALHKSPRNDGLQLSYYTTKPDGKIVPEYHENIMSLKDFLMSDATRYGVTVKQIPAQTKEERLAYSLGVDADNADFDFNNEITSILMEGEKALKNQTVDEAAIDKIATNIVRTWKSSYDRTKLADNLKKLFAYMQTEGKVNYTDFERLMSEVARPVVVESYVEDEINKANYDEFRKAIKSYRFTLSDEQKKELAYVSGSANEFRKKNIAYLTIVNEGGVNINDVWSEITTTARECGITWLDYVDSDKDQINLDAPPTMVYRATTLGQTYIQIRENHRIFIPKKYRSSIKNV